MLALAAGAARNAPIRRDGEWLPRAGKSLARRPAPRRPTRRIVFWSLAAVLSRSSRSPTSAFPYAADRLAPLIPVAMEQRGSAGPSTSRRRSLPCSAARRAIAPTGRAAFASLVDKHLARAGDMDVAARSARAVVEDDPNAFAAGRKGLSRSTGLLQKAKSADEIAGVLATNSGHVQHRDGLRRIIQAGGTSFLVGLLFGDITGGARWCSSAAPLFDASYSREIGTRRADACSPSRSCTKLGRSPRPLGEPALRVTGTEASKSISLLRVVIR